MYASALCWRNQFKCLRIISQCLDAPSPFVLSSSVAITSAKKMQSCLLASSFVSITDSPLNLFFLSSVLSVVMLPFLLIGLSYLILVPLSMVFVPLLSYFFQCTLVQYCRANILGYILGACLLYTSPSPRDRQKSRMPSSA